MNYLQATWGWAKQHKVATTVMVLILLGMLGSGSPAQTKPETGHAQTAARSILGPAPRVLLDQSGSGAAQTAPFSASGNWTLSYSFDCSNQGSAGNFIVNIGNTDSSASPDIGPNDLALNGGNTDHYYDAGQHYLQIISECAWHVTVKG